MNNSLLAANAS